MVDPDGDTLFDLDMLAYTTRTLAGVVLALGALTACSGGGPDERDAADELALALSGFDTKTAIVASFNFVGEGVTNWGALMAAASMIALPPLVLALLVQRRLVSGLAVGAVKG